MSTDKVVCTLKLIDPSGNISDGRLEVTFDSAEGKQRPSKEKASLPKEGVSEWRPYSKYKLTALLYASDITGQDSYQLEGEDYVDYQYGLTLCQNLQGVSGTTSATIGMNIATNSDEGKGGVFTWYPDQTGYYVPYVMAVTAVVPA